MRALLVAMLVIAAMPWAMGQAAPPAANILVYHAYPDPRAGEPDADPMSTAAAPGPDTARLPLTRLDGTVEADPAPEGDPQSVPAHFRELQRAIRLRQAGEAPPVLRVETRVDNGTLEVDARVDAARGDSPLQLRATVYEDGLSHGGASGIRHHRFVARLDLPPQEVANASWRVDVPPEWDRARLGVIVSARDADTGEVLQSARWSATQAGATVQVTKAVLVEHVTASWCVPCGPADEAISLMAAQFGDAAPSGSGEAYIRAPGPVAWGGVGLGALAAVWSWRRWRAP